jgi:hypothetical protein
MGIRKFKVLVPALLVASSIMVAGCHSHHIDSSIENRTGVTVRQVEVDYPSASFGVDTLAPGQIYPYRFQLRGDGQINVQYTLASGKQVHVNGPKVQEGNEGTMLIILLPNGEVQWIPDIFH